MSDLDALAEHFGNESEFEFHDSVSIYIEPGKRLSWRDMEQIRECGYKVQHITNGEYQTEVSCVRRK